MNKAFLNFFILLSMVFFANAAEQQPLENTQLPQTLSFTSALYDASPLVFEGQKFDVITPQILLSSLVGNVKSEKNLGLYAFRFFFKDDSGVSFKDIPIKHEPFKEGGFDKESMPGDNFDVNLHLLEEHCDPENKELCNLLESMICDAKSCSQHFFHSEQRILIHVRSSLKAELAKMSKSGELKNLCAAALHIYSTNDPCYNCGSSIQYVIQTILREEVKKFFEKVARNADHISTLKKTQQPKNKENVTLSQGIDFPNDFSVFAVVSSSKTYGTPFDSWRRGASVESESAVDYFTTYTAGANVKKGGFNISNLNGKSLYFWVPSLKDIDCQKTGQGLAVHVKTKDVLQNFHQLMPILLDLDRCKPLTELTLPQNVEFSTRNNDFSIINPRDIGKFKQLRVLNCVQTNARSAYLCEMFQSLNHLVVLNLNGAIQQYSEDGGVKNTKSKDRTKLFQTIGNLPSLEDLAIDNNAINIDEFCLWIEDDEKMLLKIKKLSLKKNNIFSMRKNYVDEVCQALDVFMNARAELSVDLSSNGDKPAALELHERVICLDVENDKKEENVQSAAVASVATQDVLLNLTERNNGQK